MDTDETRRSFRPRRKGLVENEVIIEIPNVDHLWEEAWVC